MPAAIALLIIGNVLTFLLLQPAGPAALDALALRIDPSAPFAGLLTAPWQLASYSLLHVNAGHLLLNMFGLWMFGSDVERVWDSRRVLFAYFAAVLTGGLAHLLPGAMFGGGDRRLGGRVRADALLRDAVSASSRDAALPANPDLRAHHAGARGSSTYRMPAERRNFVWLVNAGRGGRATFASCDRARRQ
jgi:membrane associated rhomboid family serine protease